VVVDPVCNRPSGLVPEGHDATPVVELKLLPVVIVSVAGVGLDPETVVFAML
jgi:hypothetical protein